MKTHKKPLIAISARIDARDLAVLQKHDVNVSDLVRSYIERVAKKLELGSRK